MIHRITLNKRKLFGANSILVSGVTSTWVSGETLDTQWTNANQYPTLGDPNNYPPLITPTIVSGSSTFNQNLFNKTLTIPLELKFEPTDYSEDVEDWVGSETQKAINSILDGEKVKYISTTQTGITIEFRFSDKNTLSQPGPYSTLYESNGFVIPSEYKLNRFNKSYFRLYFYDSNDSETSNLLFTEDLNVEQVPNATFTLKRLFWEKDDKLMVNTLNDRTIYMEGRFFNAKTGQVQTFYCPPSTITSPIGITQYSNISNRTWRTSPIILINPNNYNGEYRFTTLNNVNGTTTEKITLSEFILT